MATLSEPDRLTDKESADLDSRVKRFRNAWKPDGSVKVEHYLPTQGARHRTAVLVQLVVADMELRAEGGLPFRVESYVGRFPSELPTKSVPVALIGTEYQLRHRFGDEPKLAEYQGRFPARFDELVHYLAPPEPMDATRTSGRVPAPSTLRPAPAAPAKPATASKPLGDLVSTNMGEMEATPTGGGVTGSTILPTGTPYQLVRKLGSGAFGEVFEALAPGGIRVAVKRILRDVDHPTSISEKDSLDAIKELSHPYLLKTNAYWVFDDRLVIVMELADCSLADRCEYHQSQGRAHAPFKELIQLFEEAGEALDYLHSQNISHRDIKPENILIMQGHAKVADFGLARPQEHMITVVGNTVGTPAYMAPEMWQQKVSLQSDQYSLAATYVKARLGRTLFQTNVLIDMANYHINETPNLDELPEAERQVVLKALSKNPNMRYASCLEFAQALRAATLTPSTGTDLGMSRLSGGTGLRSTLLPPGQAPEDQRTTSKLVSVLRVAAIAVACAVAVGAVNWYMTHRDAGKDKGKGGDEQAKVTETTKVIPAPPPHPPVVKEVVMGGPEGWEPVKGDTPTFTIRGTPYYQKLTRTVAGEQLVALLVAPTTGQTDLQPFYMLENKVTNRVCAEVWSRVLRNQGPTYYRYKGNHPDYFPDSPAWRRGAENGTKDQNDPNFYLGIEGKQAGVPVLSVTFPEAALVARELGAQLPTFQQWQKAVGLLNDDSRPGPAGPEIKVPADLKGKAKADYVRQQLKNRNLALGLLDSPWPVERLTSDISYCGIHQLVTNGLEWLASDTDGKPIALADLDIPNANRTAMVAGQHHYQTTVKTFGLLGRPGAQEWGQVAGEYAAGFRVVLKPEPR